MIAVCFEQVSIVELQAAFPTDTFIKAFTWKSQIKVFYPPCVL